eukprot:NODE_3506_length_965_cov_35.435590_g3219_i0.p2 GENE.NODE_3506_length_965_cov_35.435590_g3219_i0~~NODE_3506_length_965_cov_35.435590_g3219_i0.p2  ORF type:complete len:177 (-),score=35.15 NODE_3506_length_965_cov_35.435590_g3219_i0:291-821(-)
MRSISATTTTTISIAMMMIIAMAVTTVGAVEEQGDVRASGEGSKFATSNDRRAISGPSGKLHVDASVVRDDSAQVQQQQQQPDVADRRFRGRIIRGLPGRLVESSMARGSSDSATRSNGSRLTVPQIAAVVGGASALVVAAAMVIALRRRRGSRATGFGGDARLVLLETEMDVIAV